MAIVEIRVTFRRFLPMATLIGLLQINDAGGQIKLTPGQVPVYDNELNSSVDEPQITLEESSTNAVMRPVPLAIQQAKDPLVKLVYETREAQRRRLLSTSEHTPWQIMHGMLALREEFLIRHNGQPVSCMEWIKSGPTFENEAWFQKTQVKVLTGATDFETIMAGRAHPYNKAYAFEGHINQFVAILSMSGVPLETQFNTPQGPVSMRDMLTYAKMTVNEKEEVTWTLWALSRYLPSDAEWVNAHGEKWSIERLVKIEVGKSLQGAPCGGTHGLFALAHARNVYLRTGKPLVGVWLEAEQKIRRYIQTARMQQNPNGTLSSNYFRGREFKRDFDKRMASSGHLLEFLMMALPSQELNAPWVRRAIEATSNDLMVNRKQFVSCSPLYHATSALSIYLDRVTVATPNLAQGPPKTHSISDSREIRTADVAAAAPVVENPEAVKTPTMESSGVDSNGAPKELTAPAIAATVEPPKTESKPGSAPNPEMPESEPIPPVEEIPVGVAETDKKPLSEAAETPAAEQPAVPGPEAGDSGAAAPDPRAKTRVFGPKQTPSPAKADTQNEVLDLDSIVSQRPSTPVPPVPLSSELLTALPEDHLLPTPSSESSRESVGPAIQELPSASVSTDVPQVTADESDTTPKPEPSESSVLPSQDPQNPGIPPGDKKRLPSETPKEKRSSGWKATPPERRKVMVVDKKAPPI